MIAALLLCMWCSQLLSMWCSQTVSSGQHYVDKLPGSARLTLDRKFPGWKFAEVSQEVRQFFETERKGKSPTLINGDFDGNGKLDHATLIWHGQLRNGNATWPRSFLVVFLRKGSGYHMYVIKEPNGEFLSLARKGTKDFNYEEQKEITYSHDAIVTVIFEKGGSSYVYDKGRFRSFVSSD